MGGSASTMIRAFVGARRVNIGGVGRRPSNYRSSSTNKDRVEDSPDDDGDDLDGMAEDMLMETREERRERLELVRQNEDNVRREMEERIQAARRAGGLVRDSTQSFSTAQEFHSELIF